MKKYPFIKQEGMKDCGCACLLMIIKYHKGYIPLEELRTLTKTTKLGTDAYHLVEASKEIGFNVSALKTELDSNFILPAIAHVTIDKSYNHYVVIYKINYKKGYVIIGDPACNIKKMKIEDFLNIWNNIIIELIPNRTIPIYKDIQLSDFLISYLLIHKHSLFALFLSSILVTLFSVLSSFYFRNMINSAYTSKSFLFLLFILFLSISIIRIIFEFLRNKIFINFKQKIDMNLSCDLFNHLIDLPYQYYHNRTTGEIISRFDDLDYIREFLERVIFVIFSDVPLLIISFIILCLINMKLSFIVVIFTLLYILVFIVLKPLFKKNIKKIQDENSATMSVITESLTGIETISNCNLKEIRKDKFSLDYYKLLEASFKFSSWMNIRQALTETIYQLGILLVVFLGTINVYDNNLSLGDLIMFYSIFMSFSGPLKNIIDLDMIWCEATSSLKRLLNLIMEKEDNGIVSKIDKFNISFKNLDFYYNDIDLVLKNINLDIKEGEKILLMGESGSGKSTLLKLLMKYYDIGNDKLFIDDIDINNYKDSAINSSIGYLGSQDLLFTGSILSNLDNNNFKKVSEIVKLCEVDTLMKKRELNFHSIIEENGFNLSNGEKQRIALARILLKNFKVILIDEGLNQMDINLERRILKRLFKKYSSKTILVVSHRSDNADLFDRKIEMNKGKIVKDVSKCIIEN